MGRFRLCSGIFIELSAIAAFDSNGNFHVHNDVVTVKDYNDQRALEQLREYHDIQTFADVNKEFINPRFFNLKSGGWVIIRKNCVKAITKINPNITSLEVRHSNTTWYFEVNCPYSQVSELIYGDPVPPYEKFETKYVQVHLPKDKTVLFFGKGITLTPEVVQAMANYDVSTVVMKYSHQVPETSETVKILKYVKSTSNNHIWVGECGLAWCKNTQYAPHRLTFNEVMTHFRPRTLEEKIIQTDAQPYTVTFY